MLFTPTPKFATIRTRRPSVAEDPGVHRVGHRAEQPVRLPHRPRQRRPRQRPVLGVQLRLEERAQPRLDRLRQPAGDDDARPARHYTPSTIASVQAAAPCRIAFSG